MKRKKLILAICFLLIFQIPLSAQATLQGTQYVVDNADLFSDSELAELEDISENLSKTYNIDVLIVTIQSLNGISAQEYAESLYDESDKRWTGNYWSSENAILFLLAMDEREWYISTAGNAIYAFTDYGLDMLGRPVVSYFSEGKYFDGFSAYLNLLPDYFNSYENKKPIDEYASAYNPENRTDVIYYKEKQDVNIGLSILVGFIAALVSVLIMIGTMNSKHPRHSAADYMQVGTYRLKKHRDMFLYSNVTKIRRQENNNRGGGSSVHRGSGGTRHGGRGGKF